MNLKAWKNCTVCHGNALNMEMMSRTCEEKDTNEDRKDDVVSVAKV